MILKVSDVTNRFEVESSLAKKKRPDASEAMIRISKRKIYIPCGKLETDSFAKQIIVEK